MKKAKKKTERCYQITEKQYKQLIRETSELTVKRTALLFTSYIMEDLDFDEDKICDVFDAIMRYSEAVNDHLITINQVSDIIYEHTGMRIRW